MFVNDISYGPESFLGRQEYVLIVGDLERDLDVAILANVLICRPLSTDIDVSVLFGPGARVPLSSKNYGVVK